MEADRPLADVVLAHREPTVREIVVTTLEAQGIRVHATDRGEEVVRLVMQGNPDVVLLALDLANVDGWQVAEVLAGPRGGEARVMALTADARKETRARAMEAGFDGYIALPIAPRDLLRRLRSLTGRSAGPESG